MERVEIGGGPQLKREPKAVRRTESVDKFGLDVGRGVFVSSATTEDCC